MAGVCEMCSGSLIREASILLNEANIGEERYKMFFQPTEEEVQHTKHL
jgi:hypothetical protein